MASVSVPGYSTNQRKTNWTTDALLRSLSDEMYQAIPFFILRPEVGYGIFLTPPLEPVRHRCRTAWSVANGNAR